MGTLSVVGAAYWAVLIAELAGDRSLYTVASLRLSYPARSMYAGVILAFACKMGVAVAFGRAVIGMAGAWMSAVSAITLFVAAYSIWANDEARQPPSAEAQGSGGLRAGVLSFSAVFLSEWADPGQIAAAVIAAQSGLLAAAWLGGTLALMSKGVCAAMLASYVAPITARRTTRLFASSSLVVMGCLSLLRLR